MVSLTLPSAAVPSKSISATSDSISFFLDAISCAFLNMASWSIMLGPLLSPPPPPFFAPPKRFSELVVVVVVVVRVVNAGLLNADTDPMRRKAVIFIVSFFGIVVCNRSIKCNQCKCCCYDGNQWEKLLKSPIVSFQVE